MSTILKTNCVCFINFKVGSSVFHRRISNSKLIMTEYVYTILLSLHHKLMYITIYVTLSI